MKKKHLYLKDKMMAEFTKATEISSKKKKVDNRANTVERCVATEEKCL